MSTAPQPAPVNMHMHTCFSFNADDLTPSELAREAQRRGLYSIAICDFDVLDGLDEFISVADELPIRAAVGMETRVFLPEYADKEINSPGEPGVTYFMGMGFPAVPAADTEAGRILAELRTRSDERNRAMIARIAQAVPALAIDYEAQVLPLAPSGNATERHIVRAYAEHVKKAAGDNPEKQAEAWAGILGIDIETARATVADTVALQNTIRSKLMKRGGVGYVQPDADTFPPIDRVIQMILQAGAIPMATWLNGLSAGESDMKAMLECLMTKGVAAVNIVPDRNWNIADPDDRARKVKELHDLVTLSDRMELPINVGTELNSFGLPFVDDFEAEPMRPLWPSFFRGARIMVGQQRLSRWAGYSYCGANADTDFGEDRHARNAFFEAVGGLPCPDAAALAKLNDTDDEQTLNAIRDSAKQGEWTL